MNCILIFDFLNDIIYTKYNKEFALHINSFARSQGLFHGNNEEEISSNVIVQIFSPIVTSHRVMSCQFGNSYSSVQCQNDLNITFEEYMGYLFVNIGKEDIASMKRLIGVCITCVRYLCGPDVLLYEILKTDNKVCNTVTRLMDCWILMQKNDQAMLVEAVEQLAVNSDLSSATLLALQEAVDKFQASTGCAKVHALVLVNNKFLALYSSRNAKELSATDILFSTLLSQSINAKRECDLNVENVLSGREGKQMGFDTFSQLILLSGSEYVPKCIPHVFHVSLITEGVALLILMEVGNAPISSGLYDTFLHLHAIQTVQVQGDLDTLKPAFENLDTAMKKLSDGLRKVKDAVVEASYKQLMRKWDFIKKKYVDYIKTSSPEALLRVESSMMGLIDNLKEILHLTAFRCKILESSRPYVDTAARIISEKLAHFNDFFKMKALCNFTLGSRGSLTINKYMEEFPGLVHFLYVDRSNHRVIAPTLDFNSEETTILTKKKIWAMVKFSRNHLQEGNLSIMWKDTTFSYAYFLWFETNSGSALAPIIFPTHANKALPQPGIISGDFYQKLKELCFPKTPRDKIRCYELYCIHLGLATASCVLEQARRLSATIWELRGHPNHPIDLI